MDESMTEDDENKPLIVSLNKASSSLPKVIPNFSAINTTTTTTTTNNQSNSLSNSFNRSISPTILAGGNEYHSRINTIRNDVRAFNNDDTYENNNLKTFNSDDEDDLGSSSSQYTNNTNNNNSNSTNNNNNSNNNNQNYGSISSNLNHSYSNGNNNNAVNNNLISSYQSNYSSSSNQSGHIIIVTDTATNPGSGELVTSLNSNLYNSYIRNYEPKPPEKVSSPFTFHRAMLVVILVVIYLMMITSFFIEYRFVDQSNSAYYAYLVTRPLPMLPLLLIIPLYGINDSKTSKYSLFIALALVSNIISDSIFSVDVSVSNNHTHTESSYPEILYYLSFSFTLLSRLFYTIAFIIGIGKNIKIRLFHAIPFYAYSATLVLMIVFSKQIAPVLIPPHTPYLSALSPSSLVLGNNANTQYESSAIYQQQPNQQPIDIINNNINQESSSYIETSSSTYPNELNTTHFSLIIIYAIIESTALWRALALTSSFPGTNPTRLLLWLSVLGTTIFAITDTLIVISNFYYPLTGIFYYSNGGYWLGHSLIVFSIPRRMDIRDYIYKYLDGFRDKKDSTGLLPPGSKKYVI